VSLIRITLLAILVTGIGLVSGCSDDDDPVAPGGGNPPSIASVVVTPGSVTMSTVGEDVQFDAEAFSSGGSIIDADFDWESSDTAVVAIDPQGYAIATGFGSAEVIASADGVTDRASVKVENPGAPSVTWIAAGSGNGSKLEQWCGTWARRRRGD